MDEKGISRRGAGRVWLGVLAAEELYMVGAFTTHRGCLLAVISGSYETDSLILRDSLTLWVSSETYGM